MAQGNRQCGRRQVRSAAAPTRGLTKPSLPGAAPSSCAQCGAPRAVVRLSRPPARRIVNHERAFHAACCLWFVRVLRTCSGNQTGRKSCFLSTCNFTPRKSPNPQTGPAIHACLPSKKFRACEIRRSWPSRERGDLTQQIVLAGATIRNFA